MAIAGSGFSGCSVEGCHRSHHSRKLCRSHYDRWRYQSYNDSNVKRSLRPDQVREGPLGQELQCRVCKKWLIIDSYQRDRRLRAGRSTLCYICLAERRDSLSLQKKQERTELYRNIQRKKRLDDKRANRRFILWILSHGKDSLVPGEVAREVVRRAFLLADSQEALARDTGVVPRVLYRILYENNSTRFHTVENLAIYASCEHLIEAYAPDTGVDGWSCEGDRYCRGCGSFFHKHESRGCCRLCAETEVNNRAPNWRQQLSWGEITKRVVTYIGIDHPCLVGRLSEKQRRQWS